MDTLDLDGLQEMGCVVLRSRVDRAGLTVHLVKTSDGRHVAMLKTDIDEMIDGRAMIHKIVQRDRAADLESPWPTVTRPWPASRDAPGFRQPHRATTAHDSER
jgi:hypothetical protein